MSERRAFSVSVFARHAGRVLLIRHARLRKWLPVGGEIEAGETPLEAARRELREETGLEGRFEAAPGAGAHAAVDGAPAGLLGYEEHAAGSKGTHLNFAFVAEVDSERVVGNGEFAEHRWFAELAQIEALEAPKNVVELAALALSAGGDAAAGSDALARSWIEAFNRRDLDALLALYADDAVHFSPKLRARRPETGGLVKGKAALRAWWADSFERLPGLHYEARRVTAAGERLFLEYDRSLPGEETLAVAELFVVRAGRIAESRVYHG
jgi:ADP-ribose pyrophosphatase YjhB (NUDIX family)/ketosteroid isomerase-like protein